MSDSWKFKRVMDPAGLPGLLRRLADALEGRSDAAAGDFSGLPGRDCRKLVLVAEVAREGLEVRLKAKRAGEVLVPTPGAAASPAKSSGAARPAGKLDPVRKEKYRQLKKGMQADYKALERAARAGMLPTEEALESFLSRSEIMVEMDAKAHGQNDPEMARAGAAFLGDALALREAFHRHDVEALVEILGRLDRRKGACHAQFK